MATKGRGQKKTARTAGKKVRRATSRMKTGKLSSGRGGKKVTNRKQAVAIGLDEARAEGKQVGRAPRRSKRKSSTGKRKTA